jgi:predicted lipoprotein
MTRRQKGSFLLSSRILFIAAVVLVVVAAALSTKVVSVSAAEAVGKGGFDPAAYAEERFDSDVASKIRESAVDLATLNAELTSGTDPSKFGKSAGSSSAYSFPVKFGATAGTPVGSILPVTVENIPDNVKVQVQMGPAINGTALRDAPGSIQFNDFTNQLEFQKIATELNNQARERVLSKIDSTSLVGKKVSIVGAFTRVNPGLISVVPVSFEVQQ